MPPNSTIPAGQNGPTYAPRFFGSAILADGTLLVAGGEYNSGVNVDTLAATHFDPSTSTWTNLPTPSGWTNLGDVPLCVLADGTVLVGNINDTQTAFFDPVSHTFSPGPNKGDRCAEESFTLLPDTTVLAVDCTSIPNAEKYVPSSNSWVTAGTTPSTLPQSCPGIVAEIGPTVLLPDGQAFVIGSTGNTALYIPPTGNPAGVGTWQSGPQIIDTSNNTSFPIDAPAVLLPNGRVLLAGSPAPPCSFPGPTTFFEYDPTSNKITEVSAPSNSGGPCFTGRFLLLPDGNVLFSDQGSTVTMYTPGGSPNSAWKPVITSVPFFMAVGFDYLISGLQFNGLSQACSYGDDATMATNYPIARLEKGGQVFYCRTAHHSTMAVATGSNPVTTILSIPASVPPGDYQLVVVANGIPSDPFPVAISAAQPALAVDIENGGDFGTVCGERSLFLKIFNTGNQNLIVDQVFAVPSPGPFGVDPLPAPPVTLDPGAGMEFTITFTPTTPATTETGIIRIVSNDPNKPVLDVNVTGAMGTAQLETVIPDNGDFGNVCLGSFVDELLTINNSGTCPLLISNITAAPGFLAPSVLNYPLRVDSGDSIDVVVRFQPSNPGSTPGTITIVSNDPASPHVVVVKGAAPAPKANLIIANTGDFGEVRLGKFTDRDLVINNRGPCPLSVTGLVSSAPVVFVTPQVVSFPLTVDGGDSIAVPIRFQPTNRGSATATLTISSNDPSSPAVVPVSGTAWPPLPIAGSPLEGYRLSNDSQHVNYIGTDNHVHELYITAGAAWVDNDLTEEAGAVPPKATSALDGYRLSDDSQHVFFIGTDNHVYELYITAGAGWIYNDLTALARAVPPNPTTALDGFRLSDDSKHVFFIGTDNHVHELQIARGGRWVDNDLTTLAGAVPPNANSALDGFPLSDDSEHVNFIGTDSHLHELTHTGAGWVDNDLTTLAGAVLPTPNSALDGFPLSDDSEHVFFIGTDSHVHELYFTAAAGWVDDDLTALT
jgi:Abnormal spindle-like microcephaly-assoc'd, ASPM-SPD-2-Hydin/Protein of unknown function (DUF1573)/Fungal fucose-specific lectin